MQPGAVEVFLDFISYSGGPLPEELLPQTACPVSILWGEADPWEPIELGRAYADYDCVEEFIPLPGAPCEIHLQPKPTTVVCQQAFSACLTNAALGPPLQASHLQISRTLCFQSVRVLQFSCAIFQPAGHLVLTTTCMLYRRRTLPYGRGARNGQSEDTGLCRAPLSTEDS